MHIRADFERLLQKLPDLLRPLATFLYYCGVRVGEAIQITRPQIDLKQASSRLSWSRQKSSEAKVIPSPEVVDRTLKGAKIKQGRVFDERALRDEWSKAVLAAELPALLLHDLRRSVIRNLITADVAEKVAMSISGYKTRTRPLSHRQHRTVRV